MSTDTRPVIMPDAMDKIEYAQHYKEQRFKTFWGRRTHAREVRTLQALLARAGDQPGSWLDIPSGAGRLSSLLPATAPPVACDLSWPMLTLGNHLGPRVQASALALPFKDNTFQGTLCFRLLPHLPGPTERCRVMGELARVSRDWVVLSFFHSICLQDARRRIQHKLCGRRRGRKSMTLHRMRQEAASAGLTMVKTQPLRRFVSEQWLVLFAVKGST